MAHSYRCPLSSEVFFSFCEDDKVSTSAVMRLLLLRTPLQFILFPSTIFAPLRHPLLRGVLYLTVVLERVLRGQRYAVTTLDTGEPCWIGVDVFKSYHTDLGVLDTEMYDYDLVYGVSPGATLKLPAYLCVLLVLAHLLRFCGSRGAPCLLCRASCCMLHTVCPCVCLKVLACANPVDSCDVLLT